MLMKVWISKRGLKEPTSSSAFFTSRWAWNLKKRFESSAFVAYCLAFALAFVESQKEVWKNKKSKCPAGHAECYRISKRGLKEVLDPTWRCWIIPEYSESQKEVWKLWFLLRWGPWQSPSLNLKKRFERYAFAPFSLYPVARPRISKRGLKVPTLTRSTPDSATSLRNLKKRFESSLSTSGTDVSTYWANLKKRFESNPAFNARRRVYKNCQESQKEVWKMCCHIEYPSSSAKQRESQKEVWKEGAVVVDMQHKRGNRISKRGLKVWRGLV